MPHCIVVPNTKTDIIEFLLLAETRINTCKQMALKSRDDYVVNVQRQLEEVWKAKRDQTLTKADIMLGSDPDYRNVKSSISASIYKEAGLCPYCGGKFKGMLKKVCSSCGKPKDY